MKFFIIAMITATMLSISPSVEAESTDNTRVAPVAPSRVINKTVASPITTKQLGRATSVSVVRPATKPLTRAPSVSVVLPAKKLTAAPVPVYMKATIRPTPMAIIKGTIGPGCLTGNLQMAEALQIFNEYYVDSEYKGQHTISGIRVTRDRETSETVYQVDLCPIVIYNDNDGIEVQASFFVDMTGEIFITERQMN